MKRNTCPLMYMGQTRRSFEVRYKEHLQAIRNNKGNRMSPQHISDTTHTYSTLEHTLDISHIVKEEQYMYTLERFYIYCDILGFLGNMTYTLVAFP
jgi:hypothetical protein